MTVRRYHLRANTVIRAGAGTGKTYALVETVTHLLAGLTHHREPLQPAEVVAITFTEKAAGEMLERIRRRVGDLAEGAGGPDDPLAQSARVLEMPLPEPSFWRDVRSEIDQLRVSTFHGFCLSLLQRYPLEAGLDPSFGVYDEESLGRRVEDLAELEVLAALDDPSRSAGVSALLSRLRLRRIGQFGFGLADRLPALLGELHEAGLEVADLPALQGPPRAAEGEEEGANAAAVIDLLDRLDGRFVLEKRRLGQIDFGDMQRLARNLLRDRPDVRRAVKQRLRTLLVDEFQDTNPIQRDLVLLLAEDPESEADFGARPTLQAVPAAYRLGRRRLFVVGDAKQSIYDFRGADVASFRVVEGLVEAQGGVLDALRVSYRSRPALVAAQNALFERTLAERPAEIDPWFVHWHDDAALRANRPENDAGPAVHLLDSESLGQARAQETGRAGKLAPRDELAGVAELIADIVTGPIPWRVQDEAAARRGDLEGTRPARWGDVNVLLRRFVRILPLLAEQLDARGIPYFIVKGNGFFAAREVADLSVALRALCGSADAPALVAWLRGPMVGVSDEALARLTVRSGRVDRRRLRHIAAGRESLADFTATDRRALRRAAQLIERLSARGEIIGPAEVIDHLLAETDWPAVLAALPHGEQALANIERVRLLANDDARRTGGSLSGFSRLLAELVEREPPKEAAQVVEADDDVVRIMTIHQSKGLECPIAIVPDGEAGRSPAPAKLLFSPRHGVGVGPRNRLDATPPVWSACRDEVQSRRLAELRRLMYVAATRARDHLVLSGSAPLKRVKGKARGESPTFVLQPPPDKGADWMHHVYALKHEAPDWLHCVDVRECLEREPHRHEPATAPPPSELTARAAALAEPPPSGGDLISAVTQLADFAICPRRYWLTWEMGLTTEIGAIELVDAEAIPSAERGEADVRWPAVPMDRGTLAHSLLERVDAAEYARLPGAGRRAVLEALAAASGTHVDDTTHDEVLARVDAALAGPLGRLLARPGPLREAPFVIHVPIAGGTRAGLVLRGQIDLVVPGDLTEPAQIVDYKYSKPRNDLSFYAFQLQCYALAHHRRQGSPDDASYRAGIVFLRESTPQPRSLPEVLTAARLEAFAGELGRLGARLLQSRRDGEWPYLGPSARNRACRESYCQFRRHCFPGQY